MNPESESIQQTGTGVSPRSIDVKFQRRRRIKWIGIIVMVALLGPYVYGRIYHSAHLTKLCQNSAQNSTPLVDEIKLFVMNIAHGRGMADSNWVEGARAKRQRVLKIAELIQERDPDVVVLNEVDFQSTWSGNLNQAEAIASKAGYPYWVEQRNLDFGFLVGSFRFGNAILSKVPINEVRYLEFPAYKEWESYLVGKKGAVIATVDVGELEVDIVAIHTDHRSESCRVASVDRILEVADRSATILAGDFNSTAAGFPGFRQTKSGENAIEKIIQSGVYQLAIVGPPSPGDLTFPTSSPSKLIDWVLVTSNFEFESYEVLSSQLSDHLPLEVTVKVSKSFRDVP